MSHCYPFHHRETQDSNPHISSLDHPKLTATTPRFLRGKPKSGFNSLWAVSLDFSRPAHTSSVSVPAPPLTSLPCSNTLPLRLVFDFRFNFVGSLWEMMGLGFVILGWVSGGEIDLEKRERCEKSMRNKTRGERKEKKNTQLLMWPF